MGTSPRLTKGQGPGTWEELTELRYVTTLLGHCHRSLAILGARKRLPGSCEGVHPGLTPCQQVFFFSIEERERKKLDKGRGNVRVPGQTQCGKQPRELEEIEQCSNSSIAASYIIRYCKSCDIQLGIKQTGRVALTFKLLPGRSATTMWVKLSTGDAKLESHYGWTRS